MAFFRETLSLWSGGIQAQAGTKNPVPKAVTKKRTCKGDIHRGTPSVLDEATILGIDPQEVAIAYFPLTEEKYLDDRVIVLDSGNLAYIISGRPSVRKAFKATGHVRCVMEFLKERPDGLPAESA
jgi:hypothetical protein